VTYNAVFCYRIVLLVDTCDNVRVCPNNTAGSPYSSVRFVLSCSLSRFSIEWPPLPSPCVSPHSPSVSTATFHVFCVIGESFLFQDKGDKDGEPTHRKKPAKGGGCCNFGTPTSSGTNVSRQSVSRSAYHQNIKSDLRSVSGYSIGHPVVTRPVYRVPERR